MPSLEELSKFAVSWGKGGTPPLEDTDNFYQHNRPTLLEEKFSSE